MFFYICTPILTLGSKTQWLLASSLSAQAWPYPKGWGHFPSSVSVCKEKETSSHSRMHYPPLNFKEGKSHGNSTQGTSLPLWSAVIQHSAQHCTSHVILWLVLFFLSNSGFFFWILYYYTVASCWDYTNNLTIAKQYAVRCSNTTTKTKQPTVPVLIHSLQTEAAQMKATHSLPVSGGQKQAVWS